MSDDYVRHAHRVQTALNFMPDHENMSRKSMRTGIDMSKSDMAGLVTLLIEKGVFTLDEYINAITASAKREADSYEVELSEYLGVKTTTG